MVSDLAFGYLAWYEMSNARLGEGERSLGHEINKADGRFVDLGYF